MQFVMISPEVLVLKDVNSFNNTVIRFSLIRISFSMIQKLAALCRAESVTGQIRYRNKRYCFSIGARGFCCSCFTT